MKECTGWAGDDDTILDTQCSKLEQEPEAFPMHKNTDAFSLHRWRARKFLSVRVRLVYIAALAIP